MACLSRFENLDRRCIYVAAATEEAINHTMDPRSPFGVDPVWAAGHPLADLSPSGFWNTTLGSDEVREALQSLISKARPLLAEFAVLPNLFSFLFTATPRSLKLSSIYRPAMHRNCLMSNATCRSSKGLLMRGTYGALWATPMDSLFGFHGTCPHTARTFFLLT